MRVWLVLGMLVGAACVVFSSPPPRELAEAPLPVTTEKRLPEAVHVAQEMARVVATMPCPVLTDVAGSILGPDGDPVQEARILVGDEELARSDTTGMFLLQGPFKSRALRILVEGYVPWSVDLPVCREGWGVDVALRASSELRGIVRWMDRPVENASITLLSADGITMGIPATGPSGRFHVGHVAFPVTVVVSHPEHGEAERDVDEPGDAVLDLVREDAISGHVVDAQGPVRAFRIEVRTVDGLLVAVNDVEDSEDGVFSVGQLDEDDYFVTASAHGTGRTVRIWPGNDDVELLLDETMRVRGRIARVDGTRLADALVELRTSESVIAVRTDEEGRFEAFVEQGSFVHVCTVEGPFCWCLPSGDVEEHALVVPADVPGTFECGGSVVRWDDGAFEALDEQPATNCVIRLDVIE